MDKNKVESRRGSTGGSEGWGEGGVGCEKSVYRGDESVHQKSGRGRRGGTSACARCIDKRRVCSVLIRGGEVGGGGGAESRRGVTR
ncbi:hypothetical protein PMAC_003398 [Pneumocystis sp. 'macacae']|nr:hypothetical protein PMAC_003398 [Pneumocystis sp. 'macacae']